MENSRKNLLVTLADRNYLDFAKQLFSSVYLNTGWSGDYMLLAHEVPETDLDWFRAKGILIRHCDAVIPELAGRWKPVIMSKMYLFTPEFKQWDKIIYLDADLIVTGSLDSLLTIKTIAFVNNLLYPFLSKIRLKHFYNFFQFNKEQTKIDDKKYNLNSPLVAASMMVINSDIIKAQTFTDLINLARRYQAQAPDLDELIYSLYFINHWEKLSPLYCFYPDQVVGQIELTKIKVLIWHLTAHNKPPDYCPDIYRLWKENFECREEIDLRQRRPAREFWSYWQVKKYHWFLIWQMRTLWLKLKIEPIIDRLIGLVGLVLKQLSPSTYRFLLRLKKSLSKPTEKRIINDSFVIRKYRPGDEMGIIKSFNALAPNNQLTLENWRWKYEKNPGGFEILLAENQTGEIIGQFGRLINKGIGAGREIIIHQIVDVFLDKRYRRQHFLRRCFKLFMPRTDFLVWGFMGRELSSIYRQIGEQEALNNREALIRQFDILGKRFNIFDSLKNYFRPSAPLRYTIEAGQNAANEINQFWHLKKSELDLSLVRDWSYLQWRLLDSPENLTLFLIKKNETVIGYFALRIKLKTLTIVDLLVFNSEVKPALILNLERYCRDNFRFKSLKLLVTDPVLVKMFKSAGYRRIKKVYFVAEQLKNISRPDNFYLTISDTDWELTI